TRTSTPRWATPERYLGPVAADEHVAIQVHLQLRDEAAAMASLQAISDPQSPRFRQYMSNAELEALHLPTLADVAVVRAPREAAGLRVTYIPDNRAYVSAEGSAAQMEQAFGTRLGSYRVGAETRRAPMSAARLPPSLASRVGSVLGLATPIEMKS